MTPDCAAPGAVWIAAAVGLFFGGNFAVILFAPFALMARRRAEADAYARGERDALDRAARAEALTRKVAP